MARSAKVGQKPGMTQQKKEILKTWLLIVVAIGLFLYLGFSFFAPVLMKIGHQPFAQTIYKVYRPACHQLAYRSFFLFGEQAVYPRELAGMKGIKTYEDITSADPTDTAFASAFVGNEQVGYKAVLCQRDTAIYVGLLLFIVIFLMIAKPVKALPWYLWILLGIVPIGLDGFWQLLSQLGLRALAWLPARESIPLIRVITGFMFGVFSAWFIVPSFRDESVNQQKEVDLDSENPG